MPGPKNNHIFFGQFLELLCAEAPTALHQKWMKEHPDALLIRYLTFANAEVVVLNSANAYKEVLQTHCYSFIKPDAWRRMTRKITGKGILILEFDEHRTHRKMLKGAFTSNNIRRLRSDGRTGIINPADTFTKAATDIIFLATFGIDPGHVNSTTFSGKVEDGHEYTFHEVYWNIFEQETLGELLMFFDRFIPVQSSSDMLSFILEESMEGGTVEGMTDEYIVGHDKLRQEMRMFEEHCPDPTCTELDALPYLNNFIKEVLRIYPPAVFIQRQAAVDILIEGIRIPKGTIVEGPTAPIGMNPLIWGQDAHEFRPERWEQLTKEQSSPYAFQAFSSGPRVCIGKQFALHDIKAVFFEIVRKYRVLGVEGAFTVENPAFALRPSGMKVRLERI
ncbi:Cytochrome P450 4e2 [Cytospora mali]|uniref:Cytochrome P450 4e2 n=1 Tax=Cytospora mali TaxID=578113 RepID=A0A194UWR5_CYTMA|nr:Cytochrome P450 4e2 [Valsa mali var. pyri (nom. inval.)]